jgi:Spy/CpxP family protein refolding chaperone
MTNWKLVGRTAAALTAAVLALGGCAYHDGQQARERRLAHVSGELGLTAAQRAELAAIVARWSERRGALVREQVFADIVVELQSEELDVTKLNTKLLAPLREWEALIPEATADFARLHRALTPEQRARFAQLLTERRPARGHRL